MATSPARPRPADLYLQFFLLGGQKPWYRSISGPASLLLHATVILGLAWAGKVVPRGPKAPGPDKNYTVVEILPYRLERPGAGKIGGGGGGGDHSREQASIGSPPRFTLEEQLAPPQVVVRNPTAKLPVEPTVLAPPEVPLTSVRMPQLGDPWGVPGPPSNGTGDGGGIGDGKGTGVGPGRGPGVGPGERGGIGGDVFAAGGGVSAPQLVYRVEPEYTDAARKAKYQGTVRLEVVVDAEGRIRDLRVVRALGLGLDERAADAVRQWKFRPGMKDGQAVAVAASIEVTFRLL